MFEVLQEFINSIPPLLKWLAVLLASMIPFVESDSGSIMGIVSGLNPVVAIGSAVAGNVLSMLAVVFLADGVRSKLVGVKEAGAKEAKPLSPRRVKLREKFDKYGVVGVSLLGPTILPSQFTSAAMVSFGAAKNVVILWQVIAIIMWGVAVGSIATIGVSFLR